MRPFKKDVTCLMTFFTQTPFAKLRQFHSITYLALFIKNKKLWNERNIILNELKNHIDTELNF